MRYYIYTGIVPGLYLSYNPKTFTKCDLSSFIDFQTAFLERPSKLYLNILDRILDTNGHLILLKVEIIAPIGENIVGYLTNHSISKIQIEDPEYELYDGRFNEQT